MFRLSSKAQNILEKNIGMEMREIIEADDSERIHIVESISKKPLVFSTTQDPRKNGMGNPLLARRRFKTMTEVNDSIDTIKSEHKDA